MCWLAAALIACASMCTSAEAALLGVSVQFHTSVETPKGAMDVYRLYANFSEGNDRVVAWGGISGLTTEFRTGPCDDPPFYEGFGLTTAPSQGMIDALPILQWETFATIGVSISDQGVPSDQTSLSPGFPSFIQGNELVLTNAVVFVLPTAAQARADFAGDGDPLLRVLLAQFTVPAGEYIFGHIALTWMDNSNSQAYHATELDWACGNRALLPPERRMHRHVPIRLLSISQRLLPGL